MNRELIKKIYRDKDYRQIDEKITSLSDDKIFDTLTFCNLRLLTTIIVFFVIMYTTKLGYITAPFLSVLYYYAFYFVFITIPVKRRTNKLDYEALHFFEILTLTLESGKNLEQSIKITCDNIDSELSKEFQKALFELSFGKQLKEALEDMRKRIPSETINNIILNITQTHEFGNSILDTMYNQIDFLREKQILRIKGQINKIPNKVSIVSVIFIVPLILLLILGPYLITLID
jgi:tight adherence protein C